ncbi:hypothetical protein [Amycolatopsis lexingtonensis]|uniref:hypothetical protein n=1 Tax=Amycolatopsis lexingtonensis TaxID=218822 RepID=UPI003F71B4E5
MTAILDRPTSVTVEAGWGEFDITPGVIDSDAVYAFENGQCHALAIALHEETGWPLVQVGVGRMYAGVPSHWMVETPAGDLLDINGVSSYEDTASQWGAMEPGSVELAWALYESGDYREPNVEAARMFVSAVLAMV